MSNLELLRTAEMALAMEIDQLRHELRRVNDGLERLGGADRELEQKAMQLTGSIDMCHKDLKTNQQQQTQLLKQKVDR